jgi:hypothetical protein
MADGSMEQLSDYSEARQGNPSLGFAGDGQLAWADKGFPGAPTATDALWTLQVPLSTPRPPQVTGVHAGANADGAFVAWDPLTSPNDQVMVTIRVGSNQRAASPYDGLDLTDFEQGTSRDSVRVPGLSTDDGPIVYGQPVTVSLFTYRSTTQVYSAPVVYTFLPQAMSVCTVKRSIVNVVEGGATQITGTLTSDNVAVPGESSTLTQKPVVGGSSTLLTGNTNSNGQLVASPRPLSNTTYTFSYAGNNVYTPCSATQHVSVYSKVKVALAKTSVRRRTQTTLTATVSPNEAGQTVTLLRLKGRTHTTLATAKLSSRSKATFQVGSKTAGDVTYEVKKAGDKAHLTTYSAIAVLHVK